MTIITVTLSIIAALFLPLVIQLLILFGVSRALAAFSLRAGRAVWLALAWIGTPVHELSHAIAFLLTGAGVRRMVLFAPNGVDGDRRTIGMVQPQREPGVIGNLVSSIAPFFGATLLAWVILRLLLPDFATHTEQLQILAPEQLSGGVIAEVLRAYAATLIEALVQLDFTNPRTIIALYLVAALGTGAAPSGTDLKFFAPALLILLVIAVPLLAGIVSLSSPAAVFEGLSRTLDSILFAAGTALTYASLFSMMGLVLVGGLALFRR